MPKFFQIKTVKMIRIMLVITIIVESNNSFNICKVKEKAADISITDVHDTDWLNQITTMGIYSK